MLAPSTADAHEVSNGLSSPVIQERNNELAIRRYNPLQLWRWPREQNLGHMKLSRHWARAEWERCTAPAILKLNRDIAIKILPDLLAGDHECLARFRREAQLLAALNHPHIAHVHGFEDSAGTYALIMELVEGPTLAEKMMEVSGTAPDGPGMPLEEALPIAKQLADALEAAHDRGILHRDFKPGNIKITPDGTVKILDFGLAKAVADGAGAKDLAHSPTLTLDTCPGVVVGTVSYMSPEQARGLPVDKRADVWAFGCVLYEMLAGRKPFVGDTRSDIMANVLQRPPDWGALPADLPTPVMRLLRRCLEKDARRRLHDMGDALLDLEEAGTPAIAE